MNTGTESRSQFLRWTVLSCLAFPVVVSILFQLQRSTGIASRGIEGETVAKKFLVGFAVDLTTLVCLTSVLSIPLIFAALRLPRLEWMQAQQTRILFFVLAIVLWQLPVSAVASHVLDAPSLVTIAAVGVLSLVTPPLLFRSIRPA